LVPTKKEVPTFRQFWEQWFDVYVMANNGPASQHEKRCAFRSCLSPFFGEMTIDAISSRDVERYKAQALAGGMAKKTLNNRLTILRRCLRSAEEWGVVEHAPRVVGVRAPEPSWTRLSKEEIEKLLAVDVDPRMYAMLLVALRAGLRLGELMALRWDDVDLATGLLTVRRGTFRGRDKEPKNGRVRYIPLTVDTLTALEAVPRDYPRIFHRGDGEWLCYTQALRALTRMCRQAGIRRITWHVLRHTFASLLADNDVGPVVTKELLGHSTIKMTMRYSHASAASLRRAVSTLAPIGPSDGQHVVMDSILKKP
jgi:integrase